MSHWTHFVTEADLDTRKAPEHEVFHFSFNNPEALRSEIIEMLAEEDEDIAIAEALESEAQSAELSGLSELSGLMVCGDDEWGRR